MGGWVRAQVTLMLIVGVMAYFGLRLLGIDYALPLSLLVIILEIVPNLGPTLAAVPAVLAGLVISPMTGLAVAALYFLIQQIQNNIFMPLIMAKGTGVNPLITVVALIIGLKIAGVVGAILGVPVVLLLQVVISEISASPRFQQA